MVDPRLTTGEREVPGKGNRGLDNLKESLGTEIRNRYMISPRLLLRGTEKMEHGMIDTGKHVHGIALGVQVDELILGPLDSPRRVVARKWGVVFRMVIIVGIAMDGVFAIPTLQLPKEARSKASARCSGKGRRKRNI